MGTPTSPQLPCVSPAACRPSKMPSTECPNITSDISRLTTPGKERTTRGFRLVPTRRPPSTTSPPVWPTEAAPSESPARSLPRDTDTSRTEGHPPTVIHTGLPPLLSRPPVWRIRPTLSSVGTLSKLFVKVCDIFRQIHKKFCKHFAYVHFYLFYKFIQFYIDERCLMTVDRL